MSNNDTMLAKSDTLEPDLFSADNARDSQYDLFSDLLGNRSVDVSQLSNLIGFWDSIPKYSVSRAIQASMRNKDGNLPIFYKDFTANDAKRYRIELHPAKIVEANGSIKEYYPSEPEELIEDILRKQFLYTENALHNSMKDESWCRFTVNTIYKALKEAKKTRSYNEIKTSLSIMANSKLSVTALDKDNRGGNQYTGSIFPESLIRDRADYEKNSDSISAVRFCSMVSRAIKELDYRQYNYVTMINMQLQVSRWLFKRLSNKYTNAGFDAPDYPIRFTDIDENSGLLHNSEDRKRIKTCRDALNELIDSGVISSYGEKIKKKGNKIIDVEFFLRPTVKFISEMKAANKRNLNIREESGRQHLRTIK